MKNIAAENLPELESIETKEWLDSLDYVLQTNGFPAGEKPIDSKNALATMKFVKKK